MMKVALTFMRDNSKEMPEIQAPDSVRMMKVWHCKYKTLAPIKKCRNLEVLAIASFPEPSFDILMKLNSLRYLKIIHLPGITDLSPLTSILRLESLSLQTLPSWDPSGKTQIVKSLEPIAALTHLRHLELFGVCPEDKSLAPLEACTSLKTARFSKYPKKKVSRFYEVSRVLNEYNPENPI